jgi:DNA-binding response OmpR family regulator
MTKTILVVDAEPIVRRAVTSILTKEGYEVTALSDASTVVEIIKSTPPALIITNVNLPGITGHDAMRLFKQHCPTVPVLMMSGLPDSEIIREWESEAGFDVFPKPFSAPELVAKVRTVLCLSAR